MLCEPGREKAESQHRDQLERQLLDDQGPKDALAILSRRQLVGIARTSITDVPSYTVKRPWKRAKG